MAQEVQPALQSETPSEKSPLNNDAAFSDLASGVDDFLKSLEEGAYDQAASQWDALVRKHWGVEFRNYAAHSLRENADVDRLQSALTAAMQTSPDDPTLILCLSSLQLLREHFSRAIELYDQAIKLKPEYAWNYFFRAYCNRDQGLRDQADQDASRAIELEPRNDKFLYFRGELRGVYLNKLSDGISDIAAAIAIQPNRWDYILVRAKLRSGMRDYSGAIDDSTHALHLCEQLGPIEPAVGVVSLSAGSMPLIFKITDCYQVRSDAYLRMKNYPDALADMTRAVEVAGAAFPHLYVNRAAIKIEQKDYAGALEDYNAAAEKEPFYAKNEKRAWVKLQLKQYTAALDEYNAIILPGAGSWEQLLYRGITKQRLGDIDGALEDFDNAIRVGTFRPETYVARGMLHIDLNDLQAAISDFNTAIMHDRRYIPAYYQRGLANYALKNFEGAVYDFGNVIALDQDNVSAYFNRGLAQRSLEKFTAALDSFYSVINLDPKHVRAYHFRGLTHHDLGDSESAIADYDRALAIDPKYVNAYVERAMSRIYQSDFKSAVADFDAALAFDEKSENALSAKSFLLSTCGDQSVRDTKASSQLADLALKFDSPYSLNARACADAAAGDFKSAIELQEQALQSGKFARDKDFDGGYYAKDRIAAWKVRKLWTIPLAAKK